MKKKTCKHKVFEIITLYKRDKPAKVEIAKCGDCGEVNKKVMDIMQEREDAVFKSYWNESPYIIWDNKIDWVEEKSLVDANDPRIK